MQKILILLFGLPFLLTGFFLFGASANAAYDDVRENSPYFEAVNYMELTGALDSGGDFYPERRVTRAEFFKLLFELRGVEASSGNSFTDVPGDAWFQSYAELAADYDLVNGSLFLPNERVKRWKALEWLMHAYGITVPVGQTSQDQILFQDISTKSPLYSLLYRAVQTGLLTADPNSVYQPFTTLTRGELAIMLYSFEQWYVNDIATTQNEAVSNFYKSEIFADIWKRIVSEFYNDPGNTISQEALFQVAVKSMLETLNDPYSVYMDEENSTSFATLINGSLQGIGAVLEQSEDGTIRISTIIEDTPAAGSGLKEKDAIVKVDGISVEGMDVSQVINLIRGDAGTSVILTISRDGASQSFTITRAIINITSIDGNVVYGDSWLITIDSFGSTTVWDIMETLDRLDDTVPEPSNIILDLRGNPGGLVNSANFVAGLFVPHLTPLVTLDYGGYQETIYNGDIGPYHGIPMFVLVDENTASAAEILSLTLREADDATIIGKQTYGKGSAQEVITYWDGSILKLTVAKWLSSHLTDIDKVGVTPDITISADESTSGDAWLREAKKRLH